MFFKVLGLPVCIQQIYFAFSVWVFYCLIILVVNMWAKTVVTYTYPAPYYYYYYVCDNDELTTIYRPEGYHVTRFTFDIPHSSIKKVRTA